MNGFRVGQPDVLFGLPRFERGRRIVRQPIVMPARDAVEGDLIGIALEPAVQVGVGEGLDLLVGASGASAFQAAHTRPERSTC